MSTAAAVTIPTHLPKPPTQAEIMQLLRERMPGLALYNPSEIWIRAQVHGIEHFFPPDLQGAVESHPVTGEATKCDGLYLIRGRFLTQRDSSGKVIEGQDAQSIVAYLIHRERYGSMGIVWLPGRSPEEDEALKALGRDQWLRFQEERDDQTIAKRREFKINWERNPAKAGVACPPPTRVENQAMERLQEREAKKEYGYECHVDDCPGYATDDWTKYATHMRAAHKITARRTTHGAITLVNAAGDTLIVEGFGGTDGKPKDIPKGGLQGEEATGGIAEARGVLEEKTGQPPQKPVEDDHRRGPAQSRKGKGKKRG